MTKVSFSQAVAALESQVESAQNKKVARELAVIASDKKVVALLKECDVKVERFDARALYAAQKVIKFAYALTRDYVSVKDVNDNMHATFKTAFLAIDANEALNSSELRYALHKEAKADDARFTIAETRKHLIFKRNALQSYATLNAQSQQCRDALVTLNVAKQVSRDTYKFEENAITKLAREKLRDMICS